MSKASISDQLEKILEAETRAAREAIDETSKKVATETAQKLKTSSPQKSGKYARAWRTRKTVTDAGNNAWVVYNPTRPGLTHLLERGHALRQGGRTRAFPHIKPAEEEAIAKFEEELVKRIEKG